MTEFFKNKLPVWLMPCTKNLMMMLVKFFCFIFVQVDRRFRIFASYLKPYKNEWIKDINHYDRAFCFIACTFIKSPNSKNKQKVIRKCSCYRHELFLICLWVFGDTLKAQEKFVPFVFFRANN